MTGACNPLAKVEIELSVTRTRELKDDDGGWLWSAGIQLEWPALGEGRRLAACSVEPMRDAPSAARKT